jgi:hypothetical protein
MLQHQKGFGQRNSLFHSSSNHNEVMNIDPIDGRENKNRTVSRDTSGHRQLNMSPFGGQTNHAFTTANFNMLLHNSGDLNE